ncbi:MAG TPA: hypothetical protein VD735_03140 [Candidatus Saccharimonadales bacterium]|nr:hypothetical protein [Candidatus Saccharimonadales bacterium]
MNRINTFRIHEQHNAGVAPLDSQAIGTRACEMTIAYPDGRPLFTIGGVDCPAPKDGPQGIGHSQAAGATLRSAVGAVEDFAGTSNGTEGHTVYTYGNIDALREQPFALNKVAKTLGWVGYCAVLKGQRDPASVPEGALVPPFVEPTPSVELAQLAGELPLIDPRLAHLQAMPAEQR